MQTSEKFKNSPIHDKHAILEMMDLLNPEQMAEVVDLLQEQVKKLNIPDDSQQSEQCDSCKYKKIYRQSTLKRS